MNIQLWVITVSALPVTVTFSEKENKTCAPQNLRFFRLLFSLAVGGKKIMSEVKIRTQSL